MIEPTGLIADDLTGAMDSGLQFAKRGLHTLVLMDWGTRGGPLAKGRPVPRAEVLVVDTDTRAIRASEAALRVAEVARALAGRRLFKKADSTMRGNVGYELRALTKALKLRGIVVAPAFPSGGRTTLGGVQRVDGLPLELTPFADDSRWPMRESHLPTLLMQQSGFEVGLVDLVTVEAGADAVARALSVARERLLVADALEQRHLEVVAQAVEQLGDGWLPCGSAGLAEAWAAVRRMGRGVPQPLPGDDRGPALVVSGTRNTVTMAQLRLAQREAGLPCVEPSAARWWDVQAEARSVARACVHHLAAGRDVILTTSLAPFVPGPETAVADLLARAVAEVVGQHAPGGLFLTGGDIAVAACRALGAEALEIAHEVQPGIPGGRLVGGAYEGLPVVTKAGGFGDPRALLYALDYLHGRG
jgi:D-threonate/D-erythronate kinase